MEKIEFEKIAKYEVADIVFEKVIKPAYNIVKDYVTVKEFAKMFNAKKITAEEITMKDEIKAKRYAIYKAYGPDLRWVACIDDRCGTFKEIAPINFTLPAYIQAYVKNAKCDIVNTDYLMNFIEKYTKLFGEYEALVAEYEAKFNKKYEIAE